MIDNTLLIRPKSGTFVTDVQFFGKMDPFLKVTIGSDVQKSDTAFNAGKNPVWKNTLSFKLTNLQLNQPETVVINFEAYDEENKATGKFLGAAIYKLSQVRTGPNEAVTIQLLDKKNNASGTIQVEFEVQQTRSQYDHGYSTQQSIQQNAMGGNQPYGQQQSMYGQQQTMGPYGQQQTMGPGYGYGDSPTRQPTQQGMYPQNTMGTMGTSQFQGGMASFGPGGGNVDQFATIIFRPKAGKFLKDADFFGKMDPFIKITIDKENQRTETALNAGKNPSWKTPCSFKLPTQQVLYSPENILVNFEAFDEDGKNKSEFLGSAIIKFSQAKTRPGEINTIQLLDKRNREAGTIEVDIEVQVGGQVQGGSGPGGSNLNTLLIRPKAGRFLKDADFFSKMDPLIKVTIGGDSQKTQTAYNTGKNPTWKDTLTFRLSSQQVTFPEQVVITFEAFDEDGKNKFELLGSSVMKLSQAKTRPGDINTIQLIDKRNKSVGTIDVEFELQGSQLGQSGQSPYKQDKHMFRKPVIGTVVIRPSSAKFDTGVSENEEFYLVLNHGEISYQSMMSEGSGKKPTFKDIICFSLFDNEEMLVKVFDNDVNKNEQVAEGFVQISALARRGPIHNLLVPLSNSGRKIGELTVEVEFLPEIFDNLVRVYPTISVKKGESITKKIQYTNPDRFKKTLSFKSNKRELVQAMPETVTIQPNEYVEIKFKIFGPNTAEDRCRMDIIVEDTRFLEESLVFKVKSI